MVYLKTIVVGDVSVDSVCNVEKKEKIAAAIVIKLELIVCARTCEDFKRREFNVQTFFDMSRVER